MTSEYHVIETQDLTVFHANVRALKIAPYFCDLGPQHDAIRIGLYQRFDVARCAALNGPPALMSRQAQETMIAKEDQQREGREGVHLIKGRGPHGARHGVKIVFAESWAESVLVQKFSQ